jgi:hypothetical protein
MTGTQQNRTAPSVSHPLWWVIPAMVATVMTVVLCWGLLNGSFVKEMRAMAAMPWGGVVIVDVYAGLVLVGAWIGWRESSVARALPWWLGLAAGGNLVSCLYLLQAVLASGGSLQRFFYGMSRTKQR